MSVSELLQEKREEILNLAAKHAASNVRIFGSVVRGEARPDSDVDFLVELETGHSLLDRVALIQDLEDLLGRKVDVAVEVQFQPDSNLYSRLFSEIFLYLRQNKPTNDWRAVVLYPTQEIDTGDIKHYREFFASQRVRRVYLDELGSISGQSIGIAILKLVIEPEETAGIKARELINQARLEITNEVTQEEYIQLIETIIVYKFTQKSRKEIAEMLGLSDFRQSRLYQETAEEVKLESVPRFLALGLSVEQIAQVLGLDIELVRQAAVSHLLASGMSVEQVAEALGLDVEAVRQIETSNTQNDETTEGK